MQVPPLFSERFYYTWGPHPPAARISSGGSLDVVCPDSDNGLADGSVIPPEHRQITTGARLFEGNPLAGPIHVQDVTPDDCLAVDLREIKLDRGEGKTLLAPAHGLLSRDHLLGRQAATSPDYIPRHLYRWRLDQEAEIAEMENPLGSDSLTVPLRPMLGCIGVCPAWGQEISSLFAGAFGGNLDLPLVKSGATVVLPVYREGALLMLGDIHAAQGAGEIVGGGIETSGVVTITARRVPNYAIPGPRIHVEGKIYAVATDGNLQNAVAMANSRLIDWLVDDFGLSRWDSYQLISQAGELQLGGLVVPSMLTVAAGLALSHVPVKYHSRIGPWARTTTTETGSTSQP